MKNNIKNSKIISYIILVLILIVSSIYGINEWNKDETKYIETNGTNLEIFFFDVGQADSILVMNNGKTMLVDGGNDSDGEIILNRLKALNINRIDYLVATHMHADHIGGLDKIIDNMEIGNIYMTNSAKETKQINQLFSAINNKNLQYDLLEIGNSFKIGNIMCEVKYVDNSAPENINLSSIVMQLQFGNQKFLLMADAEIPIEEKIKWEKIDVLKVGHHGSDTSSSEKFLRQTSPEIAVISVGKNNEYGFPSESVINRLLENNITVFRTDEFGTIWVTSDGITNEVKKFEKVEERI